MKNLHQSLRKILEKTVGQARTAAEQGARAALEALAVHEPEPFSNMSSEDLQLRDRLRAHAGYSVDLTHLVHECAYEHWHRMLFARFLAENGLLLHPEKTVPVTLKDCAALAREEGSDKWRLAARYAERQLPRIFRPDHPAFDVRLPPEYRLRLEQLLEKLETEIFTATDSLGWVYQYWQSKEKQRINQSGTKIGAEQLPAVTQLFTEPYMVAFLLDNSLGAWWAARHLQPADLQHAENEEELRRKAALPGVPLQYLRFVRGEDNQWTPAAGKFSVWPEHLSEFKTLDPCCGSGHFLVATFLMLVPMRMELEGLSAQTAVERVLEQNLHGLELDPRCVELAAFALALAAWRYPEAGGYRTLPNLNVACSGIPVSAPEEDWKKLAQGDHNLNLVMGWLHQSFRTAPLLGSLLDPARAIPRHGILNPYNEKYARTLRQAIISEQGTEQHETAIVAEGLHAAAVLLGQRYHLVVTNVPYLTCGKQQKLLRDFCKKHYPAAKGNLATVFLQRCLHLCKQGGMASLVMPQNWLFLPSYKEFREHLLKHEIWRLAACLGPHAFETISKYTVSIVLLILSRRIGLSPDEIFVEEAAGVIRKMDVSEQRAATQKAMALSTTAIENMRQAKQLQNVDSRIMPNIGTAKELFSNWACSRTGTRTADNPLFLIRFWEIDAISDMWEYEQTSVNQVLHFGGRHFLLRWESGKGLLKQYKKAKLASIQGRFVWGGKGVCLGLIGDLPATIYTGQIFDMNTGVIVPKKEEHLLPVIAYCLSSKFHIEVRKIDKQLKLTTATLLKVPFDIKCWRQVAEQQYPNGLPRPYSDDPTQWVFHGHPCGSVTWDESSKRTACGSLRIDETVLQVAVARLLGYRWPAESDESIELADEARFWVSKTQSLSSYVDKDGIVCLPSVCGEPAAADRLRKLLVAAYGDAWRDDIPAQLLARAACLNGTLETWLRDHFFKQHCSLFRQRPFIWHIWDGHKQDGFHALVNYHKLAGATGEGRMLLEKLIYSYLGDWITRQQSAHRGGEKGAEARLMAALKLQQYLQEILEGESPFDIFVRWKPLQEQPLGWEPDINDGVRLNIRPFMSRDLTGGFKGAGILRVKPGVAWGRDRGRDPERPREHYPWFWGVDGKFTTARINDVHLTLDGKKAARVRADT